MNNKSFSEFIRTASDDERQAVYEQAMKKATEEQNKVLEEYMEQIENEKSYIEGEYLAAGTSERVFSTLQALTDYVVVFKVESARFGTGYIEGRKVFILQYQPINYGG